MTSTAHPSSRIGGFHKLAIPARIDAVAQFAGLGDDDKAHLLNTGNLPAELADHLIENVIGTMNIPVGIATNMKIDGRDRLIPMATEESSVVAAVCNAARQCYDHGGFVTSMSGTEMIAQIQLTQVSDPQHARIRILEHKEDIRTLCDACDPILVKLGGGFRDLEVRVIDTRGGTMVINHLIVDTRDAMGANAVNTMAEKIAPQIAAWTGGQTNLRILSNLADRRLARARGGRYTSLTTWEVTNDGDLAGSIEMPMAVGLVGGATKLHPTAKTALKILGVTSARELAQIIAAVGLAQNFSAMKALATTGIQKGHMALHAQNIAMMAGAAGDEIDRVAQVLVAQGTVRIDVAEAELQRLRSGA